MFAFTAIVSSGFFAALANDPLPICIGQVRRAEKAIDSLLERDARGAKLLKNLVHTWSNDEVDYEAIHFHFLHLEECSEVCRDLAGAYLYAHGSKVNLSSRLFKDVKRRVRLPGKQYVLLPNGAKNNIQMWHLLWSGGLQGLAMVKEQAFLDLEKQYAGSDFLTAYVCLTRPSAITGYHVDFRTWDVIQALQSDNDPKSMMLAERFAKEHDIVCPKDKPFDFEDERFTELKRGRDSIFRRGRLLRMYMTAVSQFEKDEMRAWALNSLYAEYPEYWIKAQFQIHAYEPSKLQQLRQLPKK